MCCLNFHDKPKEKIRTRRFLLSSTLFLSISIFSKKAQVFRFNSNKIILHWKLYEHFGTDCVHIFRSISITDIIITILNVLYNAYNICISVLYGFVSRCTRMYQWIKKYTVLFKRLSHWSHSDFPPSISISSAIYQTFDLNGEPCRKFDAFKR